ncbi:MAG: sulfatase-like hydrolase/transferase, partial [Xanthomonadales bacterium]|nr:sulfatase-like hydrolase/transferase [Xanthomonadales bacterium]
DRVLAQKDLSQAYLDGAEPRRPLALSDQQFFDAFIAHLQGLERRQAAGDRRPFFVGLYNIETHAYYEMAEDGQPYGGADHYVLDAIHNLDAAFGRFWQYFRQSGLHGNTVVVLTTDHAAFQGKDFASLVADQADYQPIFVDRIPLLIHHPGLDLPPAWNARQASSIDLAPTLAHLLQLDNRPNPFLGRSIFERERDRGLAFGEDHVYLIEPGGIRYQGGYREPPEGDVLLNRLHGIVSYTQACESEGKIWNAALEQR